MATASSVYPRWLTEWMEAKGLVVWGVADLRGLDTPTDDAGRSFPFAISWVVPLQPEVMSEVLAGPTMAYAEEYVRANTRIGELGEALSAEIRSRAFRTQPLAPSSRTDTIAIKGDFPHKTAATRAGLGWIGRHCQLITRAFGSWVRLGTVFMDLELPPGTPVQRSHCGRCTRCIDACPAGALTGRPWYPGVSREEILDVHACDNWKKAHYFQFCKGHLCGICSAVCPYGLKRSTDRLKATLTASS
jgi:epoxyqueuosine reductase QueG